VWITILIKTLKVQKTKLKNHENWKFETCIDLGFNSLNKMKKKLQLFKGIWNRWYYGIISLKQPIF
jgi:hypothetical protein